MEPPEILLEVEPLDLGVEVKAVGLELIEPQYREPLRGPDGARVWSAVLPALAGAAPWALDFFSHLDRLREFCQAHQIGYREAARRCLVIDSPGAQPLARLFGRFEGETFGARAGQPLLSGDVALEGDLARRGVDAYHPVYTNYLFCAVCDFENGFLTLLTDHLWTSEVLRRLRPALEGLSVAVARAQ